MFAKKKNDAAVVETTGQNDRVDFYETMMDLLPHGIGFLDADHNIVFANKVFWKNYLNVGDELPRPVHIKTMLAAFLKKSNFAGNVDAEIQKRVGLITSASIGQKLTFPNGTTMNIDRIRHHDGSIVTIGSDITNIIAEEQNLSLIHI